MNKRKNRISSREEEALLICHRGQPAVIQVRKCTIPNLACLCESPKCDKIESHGIAKLRRDRCQSGAITRQRQGLDGCPRAPCHCLSYSMTVNWPMSGHSIANPNVPRKPEALCGLLPRVLLIEAISFLTYLSQNGLRA